MALPEINRLKKKKDFDNVFKNGKGLKGSLFFLKFIENKKNEPRFGFVVSLKVSKKAVLRNKIRRIASEIIRQNLGGIKKGVDAVIVANPGEKHSDYGEISKDISGLLKKAKITNV